MFEQLVVAIDGSEFSAHALPVAAQLAATANMSVRVLAIARTDMDVTSTYDHVIPEALRAGIDAAAVVVQVDPEPTARLLTVVSDERNTLCLATHLRSKPAAHMLHSVGSRVVERAPHPIVVVGPNATPPAAGSDVVVALDGVSNPERLVGVGAAWARRQNCGLRLVMVYEPVLAEVGEPNVFVRGWGSSYEPDAYLDAVSERMDHTGLVRVDTTAIRNMEGPADGLLQHLAEHPAGLLVMGTDRPPARVVHDVVETAPVPALIVNGNG